MTHAVIMAGGRGERFWPKSRQSLPKQFLRLIGDETMLQKTVSRMEKLLAPENIYIITAENHQEIVRHQVPEIPKENIILETLRSGYSRCCWPCRNNYTAEGPHRRNGCTARRSLYC